MKVFIKIKKLLCTYLGKYAKLTVIILVLSLLASCSTVTLPFEVTTPKLPDMDPSFANDKIITDITTVEDIVNNLLIYEGQATYYKAISSTLYSYIQDLEELSKTITENG